MIGSRYCSFRLLVLLVATSLLWACTGDDGGTGPAGVAGPAGPTGTAGPPSSNGVPVDSADRINIAVSSVSVPAGGGAPVVELRLTNDLNQGLIGLPAGDIRFVLSQLSPAASGSGQSSEWQSYVTQSSAGIPNAQAGTETASSGTFVDNSDGSYQYTFAQALTAYPGGPVFDATKTHRLGIEIRGQAPISSNGIFDFVPTGGAPIFTREIVDNNTCDACHDVLNFHGGPRTDVAYCVTCHNPSSIDEDTGNTVDFKRLIHNIHSARSDFQIVGYDDVLHAWADVKYPQDVRNCQTCHDESDADTPEASNYRLVPNRAACGTCHYDDGDAANGKHDYTIENGVHPLGLLFTDDTQCVGCHGPESGVTNAEGRLVQVSVAHEIRTRTAGEAFRFNIVDVTGTAPGEFPVVTISVTDPTNNNAKYDIETDAPFTQCTDGDSRLSVNVAWSTTDYTNTGSGFDGALPIQMDPLTGCSGASVKNVDDTFTVTSTTAIPATAIGTASAAIEGHPAVDADDDGELDRIAVTNAIAYEPITDTAVVPRRSLVDIEKCDDCHNQLALHGNNRTDKPEVCVTCHNPNMTDARQRAAGDCLADLGADDQALDFKRMIHALHSSGHDGSGRQGVPFEVCGFMNAAHVFEVDYPGRLKNCEGCHVANTYYPVDPATVLGTTVDMGLDVTSPIDDVVISPNTAVCSACHTGALEVEHMRQSGGDFSATKAADSSLISSGTETCTVCHGPGRVADVKVMHEIDTFEFN